MNVTIAVFKKEVARIFNDRKLLFAAVLLPGLLIFAVMNLTGMMTDMIGGVNEDHVYQVHAVNMPASIRAVLSPQELNLNIIPATMADTARIRRDIADQNTDLLLIFPPGFDEAVATFDPLTATAPAPNIEIWGNSVNNASHEARNIVMSLINMYHHSLTHRFSINMPTYEVPDGNFDLATAGDIMALLLGVMLPMMFILFIFTGCQSLVPESVAGEKERGTLGTLLVTTASRKQMALGKVLGLLFFSLLSALGSFIGLMFSMDSMLPDTGDLLGNAGFMEIFSITDLVLIFLIAVSLAFFFVALLTVMSTYSKTVKEANAITTPVMMVILLGAIGGGLVSAEATLFSLIPVFNSSISLTSIINSELNTLNVALSIGINFALAIILTGVVAAMFSSEKIVFD